MCVHFLSIQTDTAHTQKMAHMSPAVIPLVPLFLDWKSQALNPQPQVQNPKAAKPPNPKLIKGLSDSWVSKVLTKAPSRAISTRAADGKR